MSEVGKKAKRLGITHPRVLRRIDPPREKPTPKAKSHRPRRPFGFSYEHALRCWTPEFTRWIRTYEWFQTRAAANQSMQAFQRAMERNLPGVMRLMYRDVRKEER
jgi:hypothetical protein